MSLDLSASTADLLPRHPYENLGGLVDPNKQYTSVHHTEHVKSRRRAFVHLRAAGAVVGSSESMDDFPRESSPRPARAAKIIRMPTVAIIVIGNEILSGSVEDRNARFAIDFLRTLGADLQRIAVVPDDPVVIASEVRSCADAFDVVITSGGVGPTHDDLTYEGVALAFGLSLVEDERVSGMLRAYFGERLKDAHLRMARFPAGSAVHIHPGLPIPIAHLRNIYILPGIPELFQSSLEHFGETLRGDPFCWQEVVASMEEGELAEELHRVQARYAELSIGSYPSLAQNGVHRVKVIIEGRGRERVDAAAAEIAAFIGAKSP